MYPEVGMAMPGYDKDSILVGRPITIPETGLTYLIVYHYDDDEVHLIDLRAVPSSVY